MLSSIKPSGQLPLAVGLIDGSYPGRSEESHAEARSITFTWQSLLSIAAEDGKCTCEHLWGPSQRTSRSSDLA